MLDSSSMFLHTHACHMLLGETLNSNDVELSERERMDLGLSLCAFLMSAVVENVTLRN